MDAPIKGNAQIMANEQEFIDACGRAREKFTKIEGVVDVGMGQKNTHGKYRDDIAIVVFVQEKRPIEELAPEQRIPSTFESYRTDVEIVRQASFDACDNDTEYKKIQGGIQITCQRNPITGGYSRGTLGCIVRKRGDRSRDNVYLLTCKHVLFEGAQAGDYVYHPYPPTPDEKKFKNPGPVNTLGPIQAGPSIGDFRFTPPSVPGVPGVPTPMDFFIDCAIARINRDSKCTSCNCTKDMINVDPESITDPQPKSQNTITITGVRSIINDPKSLGITMFKVGRTTGKTAGIIRGINSPIMYKKHPNSPPPYPSGSNTIVIEFLPSSAEPTNCKNNLRFAEEGDSGAVVVDEQGRVIGMHVSGNLDPKSGIWYSQASHILPVLESLGICIPTKPPGITTGSCSPTDGSGTASTSTASAERADGVTQRDASEPQPILVTDEELEHLLRLRDDFRQTPKGRELYDIFGQVRREIGYLVRNSRRVKIAWHRGQGPTFLAHMIDHLRGHCDAVPLEVNGVSRTDLLTRMAQLLAAHGSNPLRAAIERYQDELMPILSSAATVHECLALFRNNEAAAAADADRDPELAAAGERGASANETLGG